MKTALRAALALYPRWWRERYGREMDALLEDAGAGWGAVFDIARGALVVRIEEGRKRATGLWIGRNALGLATFWLLGFVLIQGGAWMFPRSHAPMIGRFVACALSAAICYKFRASFMMTLLATLAGFYAAFLISLPVFDQTATYEQRPIEFGRIAVCIVGAALAWWAARPARRRIKVAP